MDSLRSGACVGRPELAIAFVGLVGGLPLMGWSGWTSCTRKPSARVSLYVGECVTAAFASARQACLFARTRAAAAAATCTSRESHTCTAAWSDAVTLAAALLKAGMQALKTRAESQARGPAAGRGRSREVKRRAGATAPAPEHRTGSVSATAQHRKRASPCIFLETILSTELALEAA